LPAVRCREVYLSSRPGAVERGFPVSTEFKEGQAARREGSAIVRFMLMMHAPRGTGDWGIDGWTQDDVRAHMDFMHTLNRELKERGELIGAEGLTPPRQARLVRAGSGGKPSVTDGPFTETKEFLAGYWMVAVDCAERAYEIAARASAAPGPGGVPLNLAIEVREVYDEPSL
jgi:hypothetical protein